MLIAKFTDCSNGLSAQISRKQTSSPGNSLRQVTVM